MFYVYVLKSALRKYLYTGCTKDLRKRFKEHNERMVKSTAPYVPFDIIYYEACLSDIDAYRREKYLKTRLGKSYLRKRLENWRDKLA